MDTSTFHRASVTFLSLAVLLSVSLAQDYAINLSVESKTSNSATVKWTSANNTKAVKYTIIVTHGHTETVLTNKTITNLETNTFAIQGLDYSRTYTVELLVLDNNGDTVDVDSVSVSTNFAWNDKLIAALCVIGFIVVVLVVLQVLQAICLSDGKLKRAQNYVHKNRET